ncbi:uncharacterized protein LOC129594712 [Paramacrobiotus metropolitanus]|uniref:uncharacterized protein LOC129594712 n=1 Tax=Paramacrobiotus metropolitanus TaxID=2943436 RepID=UPI00244591FE|nr:uncharacterized protein LOC129594712 [Paramacrobiotus metropolitanus]
MIVFILQSCQAQRVFDSARKNTISAVKLTRPKEVSADLTVGGRCCSTGTICMKTCSKIAGWMCDCPFALFPKCGFAVEGMDVDIQNLLLTAACYLFNDFMLIC